MDFWNLYAKFYIRLRELIPYQDLSRELLRNVDLQSSESCMDAGCGAGLLINNRSNVIGVDNSPSMLRIAERINPNCTFYNVDLNKPLPFSDEKFDAIYNNNVLAYLISPESTVQEFWRTLKKGGRLTISTLRPSFDPTIILKKHIQKASRRSLVKNIFFLLAILYLNRDIVNKLQEGTYHGFEIESLSDLLKRCGFTILNSQLAYADQNVLVTARRP